MGRLRKHGEIGEPPSRAISLRLSADDYGSLREKAATKGISVSDLVRDLILDRRRTTSSERVDLREYVGQLVVIAERLNALGDLLNSHRIANTLDGAVYSVLLRALVNIDTHLVDLVRRAD